LISFLFQKLLIFVFTRDEFLELNRIYILLSETIVILFFITISLIFIKKNLLIKNKNSFRIKYKWTVISIALAFFFRLIEDPILRIDLIIGDINFPENINFNNENRLILIILFLNSVILTPISEELIFRKLILTFFSSKKIFLSVFISSFLFSLIHISISNFSFEPIIIFFVFGFIASIIYIRFGLLYSVLFHLIFNLIWFLTRYNFIEYWEILKTLNFGYLYWVLIMISLVMIVYFLTKFINLNIRNQKQVDGIAKNKSNSN
jgi:membrane protease YdiL (CAAX protease family)